VEYWEACGGSWQLGRVVVLFVVLSLLRASVSLAATVDWPSMKEACGRQVASGMGCVFWVVSCVVIVVGMNIAVWCAGAGRVLQGLGGWGVCSGDSCHRVKLWLRACRSKGRILSVSCMSWRIWHWRAWRSVIALSGVLSIVVRSVVHRVGCLVIIVVDVK